MLEKVTLVGWRPLNREPREATVLSPKSKFLFLADAFLADALFLADAVLCCCYKEVGSSSFFQLHVGQTWQWH